MPIVRKLLRILLSAVVITLLLLVGWGIGNAAGFFASAVRAVFLALAIVAMALAALSIKRAGAKGARTPSGQRWHLALVQLVTILLLIVLPYCDRRAIFIMHSEWVRWLGLAIGVAGFSISIVAVRTLGRNYSVYVTIQEQHRLVQTGIYGVVRNPIYLGNLLTWSGTCLVFRSWLAVPAFAFFLGFAVLRGDQEERLLREEFGAEFDAYRRRTWRLMPYVY